MNISRLLWIVMLGLAGSHAPVDDDVPLDVAVREARLLTLGDVAGQRSTEGFTLARPLQRGDLEVMRQQATLSDAQFAAFQRAYLGYVDRYNEYLRIELEPVLEATASHPHTFLRPMNPEVELPFRRLMRRHIRRHFDRLWQLEVEMYHEFETLLIDEQRSGLSRFISWRARERVRSMNAPALPEVHVELRGLLLSALPDSNAQDLPPPIAALLDSYEAQLEHLLRSDFRRRLDWLVDEFGALARYQRILMESQAARRPLPPGALDPVKMIRRNRVQSAVRIRRHQEATRDALANLLDAADAEAFAQAYGRAVYPALYEGAGGLLPLIDAALDLPGDKDGGSADAIEALAERYRAAERGLLERWIAADQAWRVRMAWEHTDHLAHHRSVQAFVTEHDAIAVGHLLELAALLTPAQQAALADDVRRASRRLTEAGVARLLEAWPAAAPGVDEPAVTDPAGHRCS